MALAHTLLETPMKLAASIMLACATLAASTEKLALNDKLQRRASTKSALPKCWSRC